VSAHTCCGRAVVHLQVILRFAPGSRFWPREPHLLRNFKNRYVRFYNAVRQQLQLQFLRELLEAGGGMFLTPLYFLVVLL
jgi:hypothetical protein